jgi:hypothetical protein
MACPGSASVLVSDAARTVWQPLKSLIMISLGYVSVTILAVDSSGGVSMDFSRHRLSQPNPRRPVVPDIVRNWAKETSGLTPSTFKLFAHTQAATPHSSTMCPLARREPPIRFGACGAAPSQQEVVAQV